MKGTENISILALLATKNCCWYSLKADHELEMDQIKRNVKSTDEELEEFRAKTADLQRQLTEERIDKQ